MKNELTRFQADVLAVIRDLLDNGRPATVNDIHATIAKGSLGKLYVALRDLTEHGHLQRFEYNRPPHANGFRYEMKTSVKS